MSAQNFRGKSVPETIIIEPADKKLNTNEELTYSLQWLGFPIGKLVLKVQGLEMIQGNSCYHIRVRIFPNSFFRRFYDLEYIVDTFLDEKSLITRRFTKERRLGKEKNFQIIDFNYEKLTAHVSVTGSNKIVDISPDRENLQGQIPATTKIAPDSQDLFSSLYYFRLQDIQPDSSYPVTIYYDNRNWKLNFITGKPFLREVRKKGSIPLVRVKVESELIRYIVGDRNIFAYVMTNAKRVPFEFRLNTSIGLIKGRLHHSSFP